MADPEKGGVTEVAEKDRLNEASLTQWMAANVAGFEGPIKVLKFKGGQSNPTYRIDAASGTYVLRRKPFGPVLPSAHAVDREFKLISAVHPTGFPVPKPYGLCTDDGVIGSMFYVMEMVVGRSFWNGTLPDLSPADRRGVYAELVGTLARMHNIDYVAAGLEDYGRPGNYFARQVERWTKQYRASQTDDIPEVEKLIAYLPTSVPEQTRSSIIHGDYRIDNVIFAADSTKAIAVLDWELSTIGDPLADFAYLAMSWTMQAGQGSGLMGVDHAATGIPTLEEVVDMYCAATGRDGVPDLEWYFSYCLFRLMGIVQGIKKRIELGNASSAEAAASAARVVPLAKAAWEHALKAGAKN